MAFDATLEMKNNIGVITLTGELDASVADTFRKRIEEAAANQVKKLVLMMEDLEFMSSAGLRVLVFAKQKMGTGVTIYVVGAREEVVSPIKQSGFIYSVTMLDSYDASVIEA